MRAAIAVLAKSPVPGRVKTRLCPPLTAGEAARLAAAALADTLAAVSAATCGRRIVVLDGDAGDWTPPDFEVIPQPAGGLGARLAGAFAAIDDRALVIGMDTPQVSPSLLTDAVTALDGQDTDAVFGRAMDGGYWAIGLTAPDDRIFAGVPMSTAVTGDRQLTRLRRLGLRVHQLRTLRDVDHYADAAAVAALAPRTLFAAAVRGLTPAASITS
jgi:hypothetical protein